MKPRKPDPLPKIRIQIGGEDLKKLTGGARRPASAPVPAEKSVPETKPRTRPTER